MGLIGGRTRLIQKPALPVLGEVPNHGIEGRMPPQQAERDQRHDDQADPNYLSEILQHAKRIIAPSEVRRPTSRF